LQHWIAFEQGFYYRFQYCFVLLAVCDGADVVVVGGCMGVVA